MTHTCLGLGLRGRHRALALLFDARRVRLESAHCEKSGKMKSNKNMRLKIRVVERKSIFRIVLGLTDTRPKDCVDFLWVIMNDSLPNDWPLVGEDH